MKALLPVLQPPAQLLKGNEKYAFSQYQKGPFPGGMPSMNAAC
jgi:hypothetical protein